MAKYRYLFGVLADLICADAAAEIGAVDGAVANAPLDLPCRYKAAQTFLSSYKPLFAAASDADEQHDGYGELPLLELLDEATDRWPAERRRVIVQRFAHIIGAISFVAYAEREKNRPLITLEYSSSQKYREQWMNALYVQVSVVFLLFHDLRHPNLNHRMGVSVSFCRICTQRLLLNAVYLHLLLPN